MMTDPTADAIAALTQADVVVEGFLTDDPALVAASARALLRQLREVRSALLSAQGQAGKLVADSSDEVVALKAERDDALALEDKDVPRVAAIMAARDAALFKLTTARTALEAAEKALGPLDLIELSLTRGHLNGGPDSDELYVQIGLVRAAARALSTVTAALATIKGLETPNGAA